MPGQKLTIVPVTLHTENKDVQPSVTQNSSNSCVFTIRTAKAADYILNRANGLKAFLTDGRIEIDNNPAENAIVPM